MITWLILATGAALLAVGIYARWLDRRARRDRDRFRHITGARPWWGKR
jgi:hypothetical protein